MPISDKNLSIYPRYIGEGLNVVYVAGLSPEARLSGERRLESGHSSVTFEGLDQSCFLAADERSGAGFDHEVAGEVRAEDVLSDDALFFSLFDCFLQSLDSERILGSYIDHGVFSADGVSAYEHICLFLHLFSNFNEISVNTCAV